MSKIITVTNLAIAILVAVAVVYVNLDFFNSVDALFAEEELEFTFFFIEIPGVATNFPLFNIFAILASILVAGAIIHQIVPNTISNIGYGLFILMLILLSIPVFIPHSELVTLIVQGLEDINFIQPPPPQWTAIWGENLISPQLWAVIFGQGLVSAIIFYAVLSRWKSELKEFNKMGVQIKVSVQIKRFLFLILLLMIFSIICIGLAFLLESVISFGANFEYFIFVPIATLSMGLLLLLLFFLYSARKT